MEVLLPVIGFTLLLTALSLSKAKECYFCGRRDVVTRGKIGTRGYCRKCAANRKA